MNTPDFPEFRIATLHLNAGDLLVVKVNQSITQEIASRLKETVEKQLPKGVTALVIDPSIDLAVLTFEEIEKRSKLAA